MTELSKIIGAAGVTLALGVGGAATAPASAEADHDYGYGFMTHCGLSSKGDLVLASKNTSCPFARNAARAIYRSGYSRRIRAYSPALKRHVTMYRSAQGARWVSYRGGNNARVILTTER
jgi:hypothetical protein